MGSKKRTIDANHLIEVFRIGATIEPMLERCLLTIENIINKENTLDVEEVVRCRNCKHYKHEWANDEWYCKLTGQDMQHGDFCSYGERE